MSMIGTVYIVSAPSGAGKTSLLKAFVSNYKNVAISISHTTRKPRSQEIDGKDYYFITHDNFKSMIKKNKFIEYAKVFDHYYGTSNASIDALTQMGLDVILEIDWQGAQQARKFFKTKNCVSIFILPPNLNELYDRLLKRAQDSKEIIKKRMKDARSEISHANEYDYVIINDNFNEALKDLEACFRVQKLKPLLKE